MALGRNRHPPHIGREPFFDLRPRGLVKMLDLLKPGYKPTAAYGHFGRTDGNFSWENTDVAAALRDAAGG